MVQYLKIWNFDVAESKTDNVFSELALGFEISAFFFFGKKIIVNFCIYPSVNTSINSMCIVNVS